MGKKSKFEDIYKKVKKAVNEGKSKEDKKRG